jgi:hypothetical protein
MQRPDRNLILIEGITISQKKKKKKKKKDYWMEHR